MDLVSDAETFAALASLVRPGGTAVTTQYVANVDALAAAEVTGINFALLVRSLSIWRSLARLTSDRSVQREGIKKPVQQDSPAVAIARAHAEAWSNHDWAKARKSLAADVRVTAKTTQPTMTATDLTGIDDYMHGLTEFAQAVVPGSARLIASVGDERNALLMLTVEADLGGGKVTLPAARLYLLDEDDKIKVEQVVFYAVPD